jgi:hypothetical protein
MSSKPRGHLADCAGVHPLVGSDFSRLKWADSPTTLGGYGQQWRQAAPRLRSGDRRCTVRRRQQHELITKATIG